MQHTIESLRRGGYKVRVIHGNVQELPKCEAKIKRAAGRYTLIQITESFTSTTVEGWAFCSKKDSYNRKLGNSIALGRALANLEKVKNHEAVGLWYNPSVTLLSYTENNPEDLITLEDYTWPAVSSMYDTTSFTITDLPKYDSQG